jgi:signal transduction histidine kinase
MHFFISIMANSLLFRKWTLTKPTLTGTGLGLKLSYDIINAHGGELKVELKRKRATIYISSLDS